jgi:hypothetical protein
MLADVAEHQPVHADRVPLSEPSIRLAVTLVIPAGSIFRSAAM